MDDIDKTRSPELYLLTTKQEFGISTKVPRCLTHIDQKTDTYGSNALKISPGKYFNLDGPFDIPLDRPIPGLQSRQLH